MSAGSLHGLFFIFRYAVRVPMGFFDKILESCFPTRQIHVEILHNLFLQKVGDFVSSIITYSPVNLLPIPFCFSHCIGIKVVSVGIHGHGEGTKILDLEDP